MTPRERAEKFINTCAEALGTGNMNWTLAKEKLAAQLEEAQREAEKHPHKGCLPCSKQHEISYAEGFRAARDKAKAELETERRNLARYKKMTDDLMKERDLWKAKADKLAEALKEMHDRAPACRSECKARKALASFEEGTK